MNVEFVVNAEHRSAVDQLLGGLPSRVRIYALNIHDVQLIRTSLRLRLIRLLNSGCEVTLAFGESLWNRDTGEPRNEASAQLIKFLIELQDNRARIWYVPNPLLHAKVLYIEESAEDGQWSIRALITSANFTETALGGDNFELGAVFQDLDLFPHLKNRVKDFTNGVLGAGRSLEDVVQEV